MDQTTKPLLIPPEFALYAEKHGVFELYQRLLSQLIIHKPDDPLDFIIDYVKKDVDAPAIIVLGPPASGKKTIARLLSKGVRAIVLTKQTLYSTIPTELLTEYGGASIDKLTPYHWAAIIKNRIADYDCQRKGWVLEDFPETREQALALQSVGVIPKHCVVFEAPDTVLIERSAGKRIDRKTEEIYHTTFDMPNDAAIRERLVVPPNYTEQDVLERLVVYHRNIGGIEECFRANLKHFNVDQPKGDVFHQVLEFVTRPARSSAPVIPRIVLLGPKGAGKRTQAANLAMKYGIVHVSLIQLIHEAIANETTLGMACKPYVDKRTRVPESLVMQLLKGRLGQLDCVSKGWVLHDFPLDREQAFALDRAGFAPNRVFFLNIANDSVMERITLKYLDPVSGKNYHLLVNPPITTDVRNRLKQHPKDTEAKLLDTLNRYYGTYKELQVYYEKTGVNVNADQDPKAVFETIEFGLVNYLSDTKTDQIRTLLNAEVDNEIIQI